MSLSNTTTAANYSAQAPTSQPADPACNGLPTAGVAPPDLVTPTEQQTAAIRRIMSWYRNETAHQQVFRLFGYAGTGKTTITRMVIEELGLPIRTPLRRDDFDHQTGGAIFGAYTGKATLVMSRHGTPAATVHALTYRLLTPDEAKTSQLQDQIKQLETKQPNLSSAERRYLSELRAQLAKVYAPRFVLNTESVLCDVELIVLDEVSMIDERMAIDLLSFGKPVLVLGDPGQLPPVRGQGYFTAADPDVMLTEIHRQARNSPIIRLATLAREGERIPFGNFDDGRWVQKVRRYNMAPERLLGAGQVIVGFNTTRRNLNVKMRHASGLTEALPTGERDKIIVLKNRHDLGIVNGQFVTLADVTVVDDISLSATVHTDDGRQITTIEGEPANLPVYSGHFLDHVEYDRDRERRDYFDKNGMVEATWGNAITCHKAQGSQWPNVIVVDERFGRTSDQYRRWLYTAITRAEGGLRIYAD